MKIATKRVAVAAAALLLTAGTLTACSSTSGSGSSGSTSSYKIGLLLPDDVTARYAAADRPYFTAAIKKLNPNATVLYQNANGSASNQQQQATAMLANGVKVLVLDAFDGEAAQSIVTAAIAKKVPVIDYDRLVDGGKSNYYVSFDNEKVGVLQGTAFVNQLKKEGVPSGSGILMATVPRRTTTRRCSPRALTRSSTRAATRFSPSTRPPAGTRHRRRPGPRASSPSSVARSRASTPPTMERLVASIAAAHAAKFDLSKMALTGQDATVAGMQSILTGDQSCPSTRPSSLRHRRPRRSRSTSQRQEADRSDHGQGRIGSWCPVVPAGAGFGHPRQHRVDRRRRWIRHRRADLHRYVRCPVHAVRHQVTPSKN